MEFIQLAPDDEPLGDNDMITNDTVEYNYVDDLDDQSLSLNILPLAPDEAYIGADNRLYTYTHIFFHELGYISEEPEFIDPHRDYDAEAKQLFNKSKHYEVSSLDEPKTMVNDHLEFHKEFKESTQPSLPIPCHENDFLPQIRI